MPYQNLRWELAYSFEKKGCLFTKVIHPFSHISLDVKLTQGLQIMAGAVLQPGSKVGGNSIINTSVLLDHDCDVALNCHLAPGV